MKIGNITFPKYPVFLAPMEDVTEISFRLMCKKFGADMVYTEFISSDALIRNVKQTHQKLTISEDERPVTIQIYGRDPEAMVEAAKICEEANPDIIDINFGCPVKKVAGKGACRAVTRLWYTGPHYTRTHSCSNVYWRGRLVAHRRCKEQSSHAYTYYWKWRCEISRGLQTAF